VKSTKAFSRNKVTMAISLAAASLSLSAQETQLAYNQLGIPVFEIRFFDVGDGPFMPDDSAPMSSTWNLNALQKSKIKSAIDYWATVITPAAGQPLAIINVGTSETKDNASGSSSPAVEGQGPSLTKLQAVLTGQPVGDLTFGSHGQFDMGRMNFDSLPFVPAQQPRPTQVDVTVVALHELAHGLGVANSVSDKNGENTKTPYYQGQLSTWATHLRDDNGNPAYANQVVLCTGCENDYDPAGFDLRKDQGYFTGEHVSEVLAGAMPGIPVRIGSYEDIDSDYMSHIELKNSLMSHQNYRNYTTFMEAELAALQDLGYSIDRRNFFGSSVYGDGQTIYNQNGYYKRDPSGTHYLVGAYSETLLGLGLHVYGNNNLIYQQADLLTRGAGAAGVRIDGEGNTLVVDAGTQIHADGLNGRGVLFAYGKDHHFVQRGDVQALGEGGIAAEFNFGNNLLGDAAEYRGSYVREQNGYPIELLPELAGALVTNVDISGRLAGSVAAIAISDNAMVKTINVLSGATLQGDIRSRYAARQEDGQPVLAQLTFGHLADGSGRALDAADPNFKLSYSDNIDGIDNFAVKAVGGNTALNGTNKVYSVDVAQGAILSGTGTYTLHKDGTFVNEGTVAPTTTLTVQGDYTQTATGQLLLNVNDKGQHDTLAVSGKAKLDGQLSLAAERGWYAPNWKLNTANLLKAGSTEGAFSQISAEIASPTLTLLSKALTNGSHDLSLQRSATAYSQYAQGRNAVAVGQSLSSSATSNASADRQKLYTTLDFSAVDGSTIAKALDQLSPSAYSAMLASSVQREQQVADAISKRETGKLRADEWQTFIQPFGGNTRQNGDSHSVGYTSNSDGVIFGAETAASTDGALIVGLHGAASKQTVSLKDPLSGSGNTTALELGVHARYALDPMAGPYMLGSARVGYEEGELKRKLNFADYSAQNKADWNGTSASLVGGGGYRFAVNDNVSVGPMATLTYTSLWRDSTHEKGADGTTLKLDSQKFDSLRSSIGLNSAMAFPLGAGQAIKAEAQITWNHELLDTDVLQDATFANYPATGFNSKNTAFGRDSMGLGGSVRYQLSKDIDIGAGVSSDLFRTGYNAVSGNLSLDWRF
jgi:outer membrane autotransporter protein